MLFIYVSVSPVRHSVYYPSGLTIIIWAGDRRIAGPKFCVLFEVLNTGFEDLKILLTVDVYGDSVSDTL